MHPDPIGRVGGPVNWRGDGQELVFLSSYRALGLYDSYGRRVVELPQEWCTEANYRDRPALMFRNVLGDPREELIWHYKGRLDIYTQDRPAPDPTRVYDPIRRGVVSMPGH